MPKFNMTTILNSEVLHTEVLNDHEVRLCHHGSLGDFWTATGPHISGLHIHETLAELIADITGLTVPTKEEKQ